MQVLDEDRLRHIGHIRCIGLKRPRGWALVNGNRLAARPFAPLLPLLPRWRGKMALRKLSGRGGWCWCARIAGDAMNPCDAPHGDCTGNKAASKNDQPPSH